MLKWFRKKEDKRIDIVTEEVDKMFKEYIRVYNEGMNKILIKCDEVIMICEDLLKK